MATTEFNTFQTFLKNGQAKEALKIAEAQCIARPDAFWLTQCAKALYKLKKYAQSLASAKQAISLDVTNSFAMIAAADALFGLKEFEEAAGYYQEAASVAKQTGYAEKKYIDCLCKQHKWELVLEAISRSGLAEVDLYALRIEALIHLKQEAAAIQECRRWLQSIPHHPVAVRQLMELEIKNEGIEKVTANMARLAQIPSLPSIYKELYAALCRRTGKTEIAHKELERLGAASDDPWIQKQKAHNLAHGHEDEAIPLFEELLRAEPEEFILHSSYAAACKRIGKQEQALAFYKSLLAANPGVKSLYGRIAKLKNELGM